MKYQAGGTSKKQTFIKILLITAGILLVLAIAGWLAAQQWYRTNLQSVNNDETAKVFIIEPGTSTVNIAQNLEDAGLIRNDTAFVWYVNRNRGDEQIKAGTYELKSSQTVAEIVEQLLSGKVATDLFTIPPGLRLDQISILMIDAGFAKSDVEQALVAEYSVPILRYKPKSAALEGYLYPETYQITATSTPKSIIQHALELFNEQVSSTLVQAIKDQGLSFQQAVTLASIVQEEVSDPATQRTVAQVYLKRLNEDLLLQADPTFRYAAKVFGGPEDASNKSEYNTYQHSGLPPGPISNFTLSALEAVANPDDTDFLYFVSGDDGITRFSKTLEEHEAKARMYCKELCQL